MVGGRRFGEEGQSCLEAIDEEGGSTCAGGMGEEVEELQASGVSEVGGVGVGREGNVGIGSVFGGEVGCEVVEATC